MDLKKLLPCGKVIVFRKGEIVKHQDDPIEDVLILLEGTLKTEHVSENGKTLEIDEIKPVQIIASGFIFSSEPRFPVNVVAGENSKILSIPKEVFLDLLMKDRELLLFFLKDVSEHFRVVSEKLFFLTTKTLREKLMNFLVCHMNEKRELTLPVTLEELSRLFGCARPALSRVFQELEREGYIEKHGRRIKVLKNPFEHDRI
ncbi:MULTISPECIES: Crp/Fnr family transcriptional regulator [unclassified Thermotoga]|uniref:Crp/Fnr family transcriptional regulator n=1 Tax=unclassified Thermotoga TaxID=2631113 RepID=UPI000280E95D|nr:MULTISPECIES: Crp/Fnr family transcriptional regulator [unclassified Thermotoga]AIY87153.1 Crp/Fnr family transcriptional regulator [Thermotoga sp. 2812B]EJX25240.1 Crp/Fnr family transcriptional regulator [Thermotoga sp. EMP]